MKKKKILIVVGTRPNFVKVTQFKRVVQENFSSSFELKILHSGQHYDEKMSTTFFRQFNISPDIKHSLKSTSSNGRIAEMIQNLGNEFNKHQPDFVLTVGDVDTTLAAALAANKTGIIQGHVESGLRSFDRTMPEEINRKIVDQLSDFHFLTESKAVENLKRENIPTGNALFVGNTMIDTIVAFSNKIDKSGIIKELGISNKDYILTTFHRPSNVDNNKQLSKIVKYITRISKNIDVIIPLHPRTKQRLIEFNLLEKLSRKGIHITDPLDYLGFQHLIKNARAIITDSGGVQEESTFYHIPCITIRENTERPITIEEGTNELCPDFNEELFSLSEKILDGKWKKGKTPKFWDGNATFRIMNSLNKML